MTHPHGPAGPGPGGTTGPGREIQTAAQRAAAKAGANGQHATPLANDGRLTRYLTQSGGRLTARQRRRLNHKANRAAREQGRAA